MTRKTRQDGIRTLEDLHHRCKADEATGCMLWDGATHHGSARVWLPGIGPMAMNFALPYLATGERPARGAIYLPTCGNVNCARWEHRELGTRRQLMQMLRPTVTEEHRARISKGKREASGKYSLAAHADIMMSTEPSKVLAARWGLHFTQVCRVRRGESWANAQWRTVRPTPPARFAPDGPVPSIVNAGECRPWAAAAASRA